MYVVHTFVCGTVAHLLNIHATCYMLHECSIRVYTCSPSKSHQFIRAFTWYIHTVCTYGTHTVIHYIHTVNHTCITCTHMNVTYIHTYVCAHILRYSPGPLRSHIYTMCAHSYTGIEGTYIHVYTFILIQAYL